MKKTPVLGSLDSTSGEHRRLRLVDLEALRRLHQAGPLTIPQAYDCGHVDSETTGHGMNRLVAAGLAVFYDWDAAEDDALWTITERGKRSVRDFEPQRLDATSC